MESTSHMLAMWENEAIVVLVTLLGVTLFHYATKLWSAPADAVLAAFLGASIGVAAAALYLTRHFWSIPVGSRAFWFVTLYVWCVIAMIFFAAKNTPRVKLFLGLASQAGILYALFIFL